MKKNNSYLILIFLLISIISFESFAKESEKTTKENQVPTLIWNNKQGLSMLDKSKYKNDFYQLVNFYQPQINPLYCSVASSVMVLNALNYGNIPNNQKISIKMPKEIGEGIIDFKEYSQFTFFNEKTDKIKKHQIINLQKEKEIKNGKKNYDPGLSLFELKRVLSEVYQLNVELFYADQLNEEKLDNFRNLLKKYLEDDDHFIISNFDGKKINLATSGHISPIVAYDQKSDMILVMDVALHKNQWFWVGLNDFYQAMNSKDGDNYRGFLVVSK